mmetsp:Transcript_35882/g.41458  ORF Transcript_35882/g.41458 Transcript_35882/m.41458 type:complete len:149 (-) Transcript_35882:294-740(-)
MRLKSHKIVDEITDSIEQDFDCEPKVEKRIYEQCDEMYELEMQIQDGEDEEAIQKAEIQLKEMRKEELNEIDVEPYSLDKFLESQYQHLEEGEVADMCEISDYREFHPQAGRNTNPYRFETLSYQSQIFQKYQQKILSRRKHNQNALK